LFELACEGSSHRFFQGANIRGASKNPGSLLARSRREVIGRNDGDDFMTPITQAADFAWMPMTTAKADRKTDCARSNVKPLPVVIAAFIALPPMTRQPARRRVRTLDSIRHGAAGVHLCEPATKWPASLLRAGEDESCR
jgi:hypothetical protein